MSGADTKLLPRDVHADVLESLMVGDRLLNVPGRERLCTRVEMAQLIEEHDAELRLRLAAAEAGLAQVPEGLRAWTDRFLAGVPPLLPFNNAQEVFEHGPVGRSVVDAFSIVADGVSFAVQRAQDAVLHPNPPATPPAEGTPS